MWKLGKFNITSKVVLAPMAGYTSFGYRKFFEAFNIGVAYTEMVSDMGLIYSNKETLDYLPQETSIVPTGIQLFGSDPENILKAAKIAYNTAKQVDFFDINMACPVPKVTKTGAGSSLLKDPKKCGEIIKILKDNFDIPITAKIRLGWDDKSINFLEVIHELENAGVAMIAIHARTKKDLYGGLPRFELLRELRSKMNVPLVISGNIFTLDDAINAINITGADAVMVARGGIGNPFLARQIDTYYRYGIRLDNPTIQEKVGWCLKLANYLIEEKGEAKAMLVYRSIAPKFFVGLPNATIIKTNLANKLKTYDDLKFIILDYLANNIPDYKLELWDLYDREVKKVNDKEMIRGEVVPKGYYHLVTDIVVHHKDGSFLLMKRDYCKPHGGKYELTCGGSALKGESPLECALRELKEETGISSTNLTFIGKEIDDNKRAIYYEYYLNDNIDKESITLQKDETIDYKWASRNELMCLLDENEIVSRRIIKFLENYLK